MSNMHIALLTDGFYPNVIGGMQKHSYFLAKYLSRAGVKIDLYYPKFKDQAIDLTGFSQEEKGNIEFIPVAYNKLGGLPGHYIREEYAFARGMADAFAKRGSVDFIIAKGFTAWEILSRKLKGKRFPPVGVNFHGYEMFQRQPGFIAGLKSKFLLAAPVKFNVKHADYLFSYGAKITGIIRELGVEDRRIVEVPTGISEDWLANNARKGNKPIRFIYVGRYERRKGIEELNQSLRQLIAVKADFEFHFVGDIPAVKKIASDKITYHGKITNEPELRNRLCEMDVLVCPSHSEGMPNVILEGMASGLAVIASDTGATSLMVSSENGWLIEPGNQAQLTTVLKEVIGTDPAELEKRKNKSLLIVREHFTWTRIAELTIAKLQPLIRNV